MKPALLLLALSLLSLAGCSASSKSAVRGANDSVAELCKILPPLDPIEQQICATEIELAPLVDKIFAHRRDLGLVKDAGPSASASAATSAPAAAPASSKADKK